MEHHDTDTRPLAGRGAAGDDPALFLRELRQLRDGAGLGHAELAARAHYPYDSIRAAEAGPSLPDLPVLSAFVRGCGGTTEEWEERWRSLTRTPSLPVSEARQSGQSEAASAGARINSATLTGEAAPDPSAIMAALNRVAKDMGTPGADFTVLPEGPSAAPSLPDFPSPPLPGDLTGGESLPPSLPPDSPAAGQAPAAGQTPTAGQTPASRQTPASGQTPAAGGHGGATHGRAGRSSRRPAVVAGILLLGVLLGVIIALIAV